LVSVKAVLAFQYSLRNIFRPFFPTNRKVALRIPIWDRFIDNKTSKYSEIDLPFIRLLISSFYFSLRIGSVILSVALRRVFLSIFSIQVINSHPKMYCQRFILSGIHVRFSGQTGVRRRLSCSQCLLRRPLHLPVIFSAETESIFVQVYGVMFSDSFLRLSRTRNLYFPTAIPEGPVDFKFRFHFFASTNERKSCSAKTRRIVYALG